MKSEKRKKKLMEKEVSDRFFILSVSVFLVWLSPLDGDVSSAL